MEPRLRNKLPRLVLFEEHGLEAHTIKSLKLVILAIAFGIVQFNIVNGVAIASYLRSLGVSNFVFGLLFAIGPIISPMQLVASYIMERTRKRRQLLIIAGIIHRVVWLPFGLVPFFIPMEHYTLRIWMAALFLFVVAFAQPFLNVTFFSMMADIVPARIRGRYFAMRMRISTICGIIGGFVVALILDNVSPFYSYAFVFSIAAILGTMDILCYFGVKDPPMEKSEKEGESFITILKTVIKNKPYMRFILFMTFWLFSLNLSAPFILVHLGEGVQLSNTLITVAVQISPNLCSVFILTRWGRALDAHGNKPVMQVANGILCFAPFLWIITANNQISVVFIMLIGVMTGLLLPGFDLGVNNMIMSSAPKVNRSMYIAMYFMCTSIIGIGLANATGGWLLDNVFSHAEALNLSMGGVTFTRFNYLFGVSALMRCFMVYIALPRLIKEDCGTSAMELLKDIIKKSRTGMRRKWTYARWIIKGR